MMDALVLYYIVLYCTDACTLLTLACLGGMHVCRADVVGRVARELWGWVVGCGRAWMFAGNGEEGRDGSELSIDFNG
jgi:hypothetical protein